MTAFGSGLYEERYYPSCEDMLGVSVVVLRTAEGSMTQRQVEE